MDIYQEKILKHYHHPSHNQALENYTHRAKVENLSCGDAVEIFLLVENNEIVDIGFVGEGCAIAIASASLLTERLLGRQLNEVVQMSDTDMFALLGIDLRPSRQRCATLSLETARQALATSV